MRHIRHVRKPFANLREFQGEEATGGSLEAYLGIVTAACDEGVATFRMLSWVAGYPLVAAAVSPSKGRKLIQADRQMNRNLYLLTWRESDDGWSSSDSEAQVAEEVFASPPSEKEPIIGLGALRRALFA